MSDDVVRLQSVYFSRDNLAGHGKGNGGRKNNENRFELNLENFLLKKQEKVFLHGPSGSGKSTLLGLICGTIKPQSGRVFVNGKCLGDMGGSRIDRYRSDNIGIIFQMFNLLDYISAMENILLPLEFSKSRRVAAGSDREKCKKEACRLLQQLGLDADRERNARPVSLSVGQQQRVAAARAMIGQPGLIIADEPTSALDESGQDKFIDLIFSEVERSRASLIMASHNHRLERHFDCSISLENN